MHFLTEHAQNSVSTAVRQISPPGSISVVRTRLADLELQNVLDGKGAILGHRNDTDGLPTPSILSVSFWDVVTCLLKKKKDSLCMQDIPSSMVSQTSVHYGHRAKARNASLRGQNPLTDLPPWALCRPLPAQPHRQPGDHPTLGSRSALHSDAWPQPLLGEPGVFRLVSRTLL